ncbi:MAG: glycosyltransferase family protein [Acidimicrobiia bacterium]
MNLGRVLIYSHDTYGLGHLRRSLLIAGRLASLPQVSSVLIATGSPRTQAFSLPPGCDTVKLPAVTKTPEGCYRARTLQMPLGEVVTMRAGLLRVIADTFRPDLILVDHAPTGMGGELRPLFDHLTDPAERPSMLLGLRDIIDEPEQVRAEWDRAGVWEALETVYDRIVVYGDPRVGTTAQDLDLPALLPGKVRFAGYLGRPVPLPHRNGKQPLILVTAGGGGDGQETIQAYGDFLEAWPGRAPFRSLVVTGPLLSARRRRQAAARFRGIRQPVQVETFVEGMERLIGTARGVIAMAGYNTVIELLASSTPALLLPRTSPRREQLIRAERIAPLAGFQVCSNPALAARSMGEFVRGVLNGGTRTPWERQDGLETVAQEVAELIGERQGAQHAAVE